MDEQQRMLEQTTSALERALLQEGRAYRASEDLRAHTLAGLGLAASAGVVASTLAWLSARSWLSKVIFGLSTMTLLVGVGVSRMVLHRDTGAGGLGSPVAVVMPPPALEPAPTSPPSPVAVASLPLRRAADSPVAPAAVPARPSAGYNSALRAELAALDAIRSTLANDDPAGALSFLTAYFHTFPRGRLHFEAEVLRIDALAKAGQTNAAGRHAREFLRRHPNSVLTARVRPFAEP
jgi:hypothetical protein